jgi:hypothetical protein
MFCPPSQALRIFFWKIPTELQGGQTNFLNENYTVSLQTKSNILALSISYHCAVALKKRNRDIYFTSLSRLILHTSYMIFINKLGLFHW